MDLLERIRSSIACGKKAVVLCSFAATLCLCSSAAYQSTSGAGSTDLEKGIAFLREGQIAAACERFKAAIEIDPKLPKAHLYLGIAENQQGHFANAIPAFRDALRLDASSEAAHYNLALSLLALQNIEEAVQEFRAVLKLNPENGSANYNLALLLAQQGHLQEACDYLERVRSLQPGDPAVWVHLTDLYLRTGKDPRALQLVREGTRIDSDGTLSMELGKLLLERNRFKEALPALEKAQNFPAVASRNTGYLARAYLGAGEPAKVIELLASIRNDQASWEVYDLRGLAAMALGHRKEAAQAFSTAIEMRPAEASIHHHLGQLLLASQDNRERLAGVTEVSKAIESEPSQSSYYLTLGSYYFDTGNLKATIDLLTSALDRVPPSVQIYVTLGLAQLELHGPTSAEPVIQKAIALDPQAGAGYDLLGRCRIRIDDYESAARYFRKAAKLTPENDIYFRDAAIALDKLGDSASGLPFAEQSVKLRPNEVFNHYILGKLYAQVGRRPDAIRELEKCVSLDARNSLPYSLLAGLYKRSGEDAKAAGCWRTLRELKQQGAEKSVATFSRLGSVPQ